MKLQYDRGFDSLIIEDNKLTLVDLYANATTVMKVKGNAFQNITKEELDAIPSLLDKIDLIGKNTGFSEVEVDMKNKRSDIDTHELMFENLVVNNADNIILHTPDDDFSFLRAKNTFYKGYLKYNVDSDNKELFEHYRNKEKSESYNDFFHFVLDVCTKDKNLNIDSRDIQNLRNKTYNPSVEHDKGHIAIEDVQMLPNIISARITDKDTSVIIKSLSGEGVGKKEAYILNNPVFANQTISNYLEDVDRTIIDHIHNEHVITPIKILDIKSENISKAASIVHTFKRNTEINYDDEKLDFDFIIRHEDKEKGKTEISGTANRYYEDPYMYINVKFSDWIGSHTILYQPDNDDFDYTSHADHTEDYKFTKDILDRFSEVANSFSESFFGINEKRVDEICKQIAKDEGIELDNDDKDFDDMDI